MKAWAFQDTKQLAKHGAKACPWSVGWYDSRGRKRQKTIGTKTHAKAYARKLEGEQAAGLLRSVERVRWPEFVKRFDRDHLATKATSTRKVYLDSLERFKAYAPAFVDQIDESVVDKFASKRLAEGVEPATVNKDLRHIRCALGRARRWKLIPAPIEVAMLREPERDPEFIDDDTFAKLYDACGSMTRPHGGHFEPADWWRAVLTFAYLTGWRIGEILALRRDAIDWGKGVAVVGADKTKGRRDARVDLHPAVLEHLKAIIGFEELAFNWPHHERTLWLDFAKLKEAAGVEFSGVFHRFRFGFANANVDSLPADVLQRLMRHRDPQTTRKYINMAERMRRQNAADHIHLPEVLAKRA